MLQPEKFRAGRSAPIRAASSPNATRNDATQRSLASMSTPNTYLPGSTGVAECLPSDGATSRAGLAQAEPLNLESISNIAEKVDGHGRPVNLQLSRTRSEMRRRR